MMERGVQVVVAAMVLAMILLVGTTLLGDITSGEEGVRNNVGESALLGDTSTFISLGDGEGYDETVYDSRGHAINTTGANDSYVKSTQGYEIASDDTWSVSVWGHVDSGSSGETMTAVSLNGRVVINYNGSDGNWTVWYYDESSTNSYQANVSAPDQPSALVNVQVVSNGSHMTIYRNNSSGETVNVSGSNIADAPVKATNWDGRLDELRTFDDALNGSQRGALYNDGVGPLANGTRTSRVMFDEPDAGQQQIFFTNADLEQSNVSFSEGLAGEEMTSASALLGQADYEWEATGPRIRPVSGGELEGAPVAYVDYEYEDALADVIGGWSGFVGMAAMVPLLAIAGLLVSRLQGV